MKFTSKQILIVVAVILVIFIIIGIWFYRKGKKQTTIAPVPKDIVPGSNNAYGVSPAEILSIADALHTEMDGLNLWGHDVAPYVRLVNLSDTDFVKVYNAFNEKYQKESKETLKGWIESETFVFDDVTDAIIERMGRLNLK